MILNEALNEFIRNRIAELKLTQEQHIYVNDLINKVYNAAQNENNIYHKEKELWSWQILFIKLQKRRYQKYCEENENNKGLLSFDDFTASRKYRVTEIELNIKQLESELKELMRKASKYQM